jgi:hypothetical protein
MQIKKKPLLLVNHQQYNCISFSFLICIIVSEVTLAGTENEYVEFGIDRSKQASSFTAFFSVVCVVAGTGALGLPYGLSQGGWIGLFILSLSWILSICKFD